MIGMGLAGVILCCLRLPLVQHEILEVFTSLHCGAGLHVEGRKPIPGLH